MSTIFTATLFEATDETTYEFAEYPAVYTKLLTDIDTEFASCALMLDDLLLSTSVNHPTMLRKQNETWSLDDIGYKYVPAYYHRDYSSEAEDCSWQVASQAIEDHDWTFDSEAGGHNIHNHG